MTEGLELPNEEKNRMLGEKEITKEYWKRTTLNKWRWKKKFKMDISEERENYSKPNYTEETL